MNRKSAYRITSPGGWVIEAADETAHRRILVTLACLSDVLARSQQAPPSCLAAGRVSDAGKMPGPCSFDGGGDTMRPVVLPTIDDAQLRQWWEAMMKRTESGGDDEADPPPGLIQAGPGRRH